jgi:hypothetical protein
VLRAACRRSSHACAATASTGAPYVRRSHRDRRPSAGAPDGGGGEWWQASRVREGRSFKGRRHEPYEHRAAIRLKRLAARRVLAPCLQPLRLLRRLVVPPPCRPRAMSEVPNRQASFSIARKRGVGRAQIEEARVELGVEIVVDAMDSIYGKRCPRPASAPLRTLEDVDDRGADRRGGHVWRRTASVGGRARDVAPAGYRRIFT